MPQASIRAENVKLSLQALGLQGNESSKALEKDLAKLANIGNCSCSVCNVPSLISGLTLAHIS